MYQHAFNPGRPPNQAARPRRSAQVEAADPGLAPMEALLAALRTTEEIFRPREFLLRRARVIAANPALAERDLIKLAGIADALTRALERRGAEPGKARFIIDVVLATHRRAVSRWLANPDAPLSSSSPRPLPSCTRPSRRQP